jgi:hypothetical protein
VGEPVLTQHDQDGLRQRHTVRAARTGGTPVRDGIAILAPFPVADAQQVTVAINVGHLQMQPFLQTQPTGVDRAEVDPVTRATDTRQDTAHFVHAEHYRQFLLLGRTHQLEGFPFPSQGVLEEKLDPAQGDGAGVAEGLLGGKHVCRS